ncbi:hypothetical protein [Hamadaea tsunoensis]|uniref:hypothetical protein n=1 Tax=Hamadaea tsunoensis TaxID=53368 RepID=UPI0004012D1D|nr:hypothetical protein [Hamadaea tsunoensis]
MRRLRTLIAPVALTALVAAALAGCGMPPDMKENGRPIPSPQPVVSATGLPPVLVSTPPSASASPLPSGSAPGTGPSFSEAYYVNCLGQPSGDQVIATIRAKTRLLPKTGAVLTTTGPLCSGGWQYTIVQATGKDPLVVVTKGLPTALTIVTAGSDVCTISVRTQAPAGLLAAANC